MTIWALSPLPLYFDPTLFGIFTPHTGSLEFVRHVGLIWLVVGLGGLLFRTVQLFFIKDVQTGLVWATKILTDPFHDIKLYHKAPLYLLRGELIDPRHADWSDEEAEEAPRAGCTVAFQVIARLDENRCAIISFRMRRLIDLFVVAASHHHQPSRCIALAAATKRSATASKSSSL